MCERFFVNMDSVKNNTYIVGYSRHTSYLCSPSFLFILVHCTLVPAVFIVSMLYHSRASLCTSCTSMAANTNAFFNCFHSTSTSFHFGTAASFSFLSSFSWEILPFVEHQIFYSLYFLIHINFSGQADDQFTQSVILHLYQ